VNTKLQLRFPSKDKRISRRIGEYDLPSARFGESNVPVLDKIEGRFAQILPPKVATAKHCMVAHTGHCGSSDATSAVMEFTFGLDRWCPTRSAMLAA